MKHFFTLILLSFYIASSAQIITEIMYNPPESGTDSLEYVEIYNNTGADINLEGYSFEGFDLVFESRIFASEEYLVVAVNSAAMQSVFGVPATQWESGGLNNSGEEISIINPDNIKISTVRYESGGAWSEMADAQGFSLELCDVSAFEFDPANWGVSNFDSGAVINGVQIFGSPGRANEPDCSMISEEVTTVAINEVMYNAPGDSLEYIEFFNYGTDTVNLSGWTIDGDVTYNLPGLSLQPNSTLLIASNESVIENQFNTFAFQWPAGQTLGDEVGEIRLFTGVGTLVETLNYGSSDPWPTTTAGVAITRCDYEGSASAPESWVASSIDILGDQSYFGSPGLVNQCGNLTIGEATATDADGSILMDGETATLTGIVHSPNYNGSGLQFALIDNQNDGINVFTFSSDTGYEPILGDNITVTGELGQFNGLAQIQPTSIVVNSIGNLLFEPTEVTQPSEETESQLITIRDVQVIDPEDWTNQGSGFNVDITNGVDTVLMRIDADISSIFDLGYPQGTFNVTGIGWQFDNSSPYDSGYQIQPRFIADIDPYDEFMPDTTTVVDAFPLRTILEMTNVTAEGVADSLGVSCALEGIVHGVNFSGSDLIMTIIDENNNGIGVFNNDNTVGYVVQEGDLVRLKGSISQFNGLTQLATDSLEILSIGNDLVSPILMDVEVDNFEEVNESSLISLGAVTMADVTQWDGDGSSFNIDLLNSSGQEFTMRIDNDTELASMPLPEGLDGLFVVTGLQGQFDSSEPFDSGYQILPRYIADFQIISNVIDTEFDSAINIYPNPASELLEVRTENEIEAYKIYNSLGQLIESNKFDYQISVSHLPEGSYSILFSSGEKLSTKKFIKIK